MPTFKSCVKVECFGGPKDGQKMELSIPLKQMYEFPEKSTPSVENKPSLIGHKVHKYRVRLSLKGQLCKTSNNCVILEYVGLG